MPFKRHFLPTQLALPHVCLSRACLGMQQTLRFRSRKKTAWRKRCFPHVCREVEAACVAGVFENSIVALPQRHVHMAAVTCRGVEKENGKQAQRFLCERVVEPVFSNDSSASTKTRESNRLAKIKPENSLKLSGFSVSAGNRHVYASK